MGKTFHHGRRASEQQIFVRAIRRSKPDLKRLSKALISLAASQLEKEAEREHHLKQKGSRKNKKGRI